MESKQVMVSSELYSEKNYISSSKPHVNQNNVVSKFLFFLPPSIPKIDADGDFILDRRQDIQNSSKNSLEIEHSNRTVLDLVGLQIWRGAFLLADWLIHNNTTLKTDEYFLELGSGVGLTSIVAAMYAPVICTDIDEKGILELIDSNIKRNKNYVKFPVLIKGLDFTSEFSDEIEKLLPKVKIILAADVIYYDYITEAFVNTLYKLLEKITGCTIYVALEKRYVFTTDDLMTNAPCYDYFLDRLELLNQLNNVTYEEIPIDFPQYFDYERVNQLVLWKISSK